MHWTPDRAVRVGALAGHFVVFLGKTLCSRSAEFEAAKTGSGVGFLRLTAVRGGGRNTPSRFKLSEPG